MARTPTPIPGGLFEPAPDEEPIEIPAARLVAGEETGRLTLSMLDATGSIGDEAEAAAQKEQLKHSIIELANHLIERSNGNGGGPPIDFKKFSKKNWVINALIGAVVAAAAGFGGYKVLQATVADHSEEIQINANNIEENSKALKEVGDAVDDVADKLDDGAESQKILIESVESLKKEAQTDKQKRLERELEEARRELRRRRRDR